MFNYSHKVFSSSTRTFTTFSDELGCIDSFQNSRPKLIKEALAEDSEMSNLLLLSSSEAYFTDSRSELIVHPALVFNIELLPDKTFNYIELLNNLLATNAKVLTDGLASSSESTQSLTNGAEVMLFLDSANKAKDAASAYFNPWNTQEGDFHSSAFIFAKDLSAAIVCAAIVADAKAADLDLSNPFKSFNKDNLSHMNSSEISLLSKLMNGSIRSEGGIFFIDSNGNLNFSKDFLTAEDHIAWAFAQKA